MQTCSWVASGNSNVLYPPLDKRSAVVGSETTHTWQRPCSLLGLGLGLVETCPAAGRVGAMGATARRGRVSFINRRARHGALGLMMIRRLYAAVTMSLTTSRTTVAMFRFLSSARFLTALRAGPPFSWGVTSGGPPGGRSLSKDGTRADSAKDFCRLVCVIRRKSDLCSLSE